MAEISRIQTIDGTMYDIKDAQARKKADVYFVTAPDTDTTAGTWTGTLTGLTEYYDGLTIIFVPNVDGVSAGVTLNINDLGEIPCYLADQGNIAKLTTHYPAGIPIPFTYINGKFIHADYSRANDNTTNISVLNHGAATFVADSVIYRYQLLFQIDENTLTPLNNVSNGYSKTNKAILTSISFNPFGKIFYYFSTKTVSAGGNAAGGVLCYQHGTVDLRYSLNISASVNALTAEKDVYMKVIPQIDGTVKLAAAFPLVQTLPTTYDGYWYIYLGRAYSTYQINLYQNHPVYYHNGTSIVRMFPPETALASTENAGLMSSADKAKLDNIEEPLEYEITISADSATTKTITDARIAETHIITNTVINWEANIGWITADGSCTLVCTAGIPAMTLHFKVV